MSDFAKLRERMVRRQIEARGISDPLILDAFRAVPREAFVDEGQRQSAYQDHPLAIGVGQTISQPYIVALMIEAAAISPGDVVLEVGSGSGYAAAVMSRIARAVIGVERQHDLIGSARERLHRLGYDNVSIVEGDGTRGWPDDAPFDAVVAAAAGSHVPTPLINQLAPGGRLVIPIGEPADVQDLIKVVKRPDGSLVEENLGSVRFVPLIGEEGWSDD